MPINLEIGENDHIPDNMTLEQMQAALDMDKDEAMQLTKGEDPLFTAEQVEKLYAPKDAPADNVLDGVTDPAQVVTPAPDVVPQQPAAPAQATPPAPPALPDVTEAQKVVQGHMTAVEAINAKYDDGEMSREEWTAAITAQTEAMATAKAQIVQVQTATQAYQQSMAAQWQPVIQAFQAQHAHLSGPDIDPDVYKAWDAALVQVNSAPQYAHLGFQARAELVYDVLAPQMRAMGKVFPDRAPTPAAAAQPGPLTTPRPDPVQTLSGIANSSLPPVNDSTFAALDTLDPEAAEAAMARMTPEQMDKYLHAYGGGYYGTEG